MAHATTAGPQTGDAPLAIHHSAPPAPSSPPRIPTDLAVLSSLELPPPPSSSCGLFGKLSGPWLIDPSGLTFVWVGFPPRKGVLDVPVPALPIPHPDVAVLVHEAGPVLALRPLWPPVARLRRY